MTSLLVASDGSSRGRALTERKTGRWRETGLRGCEMTGEVTGGRMQLMELHRGSRERIPFTDQG